MSFCAYADGDAMLGVTSVANMFITEYLPDAPSDYVKVYLYGLFLCRYPHLCESVERMGELLHIDAGTVKNAMSYWEREGAVIKLSDNPPSYSFLTLAPSGRGSNEPDDGVYSNRGYIRTLQSLLPSLALENHELRIANDWLDVYGLSMDAVSLMIKTEVDRRQGKLPSSKTLFKKLNETALEWANAGVKDLTGAKAYIAKSGANHKVAKSVIERFSLRREPTVDEINMAGEWVDKLGYTTDEILAACEETTKTGNPSFSYLNSVLVNRKENPDGGERDMVKKLNGHLGISVRPTPAQTEALSRFLKMGFEFAAIEQAAVQCGENNRRTYEAIEKKLNRWREAGVFTVKDIEEERRQRKLYKDLMYDVLEKAGAERTVTEADIKALRIWTALIDTDAVLYAAEFARGTDNAIKYIDKVIRSWSAQGITTLEKAKAQKPPKSTGKDNNPSKIMNEREIKDQDYGKEYYFDVMKLDEAGA